MSEPVLPPEEEPRFIRKSSPLLAILLGMWLGSTLMAMWSVAWAFAGIGPALEANEQLASRVDFRATDDPGDRAKLRRHPIWVYAGEYNRHTFVVWNRFQLGLAAAIVLVALARQPAAGVLLSTILAGGAVALLTFWLAPEVTAIGRSLDFVPRPPPGVNPDFDRFDELHRVSTTLEAAKTVLVALATVLVWRGRRVPAPE